MVEQGMLNEKSFSLLTIIVNRGKGSKVLKFVQENGAFDASCLLGKGTINNKMLQIMEMNDIEKELVLIIVSSDRENEILNQLNIKFSLERKNHGIAFIMPLSAIMKIKKDTSIKWHNSSLPQDIQLDYATILTIVDKGQAENVVQISQANGYYGGTIIKARGSAGKQNMLLDMMVNSEKEAVLMLLKSNDSDHLAAILIDQLHLNEPEMGILIKVGVSKTVGLFRNNSQEG